LEGKKRIELELIGYDRYLCSLSLVPAQDFLTKDLMMKAGHTVCCRWLIVWDRRPAVPDSIDGKFGSQGLDHNNPHLLVPEDFELPHPAYRQAFLWICLPVPFSGKFSWYYDRHYIPDRRGT
jgi:hypothetical protein